jgi:hypothetical protein
MLTTRRINRTAAACGLALALLAAPAAAQQDLRNPDNREPAPTSGPRQDLRSPDARDAAAGRGTFSAPDTVVVKLREPVPATNGGIDWGDAGVGAGSLLGVIAIGAAGSAAVLHRRRRTRPSAASVA